eukprot:Skav218082  [mRNA]  locus=scaffold3382:43081:43671:+ [translate_table: standard]
MRNVGHCYRMTLAAEVLANGNREILTALFADIWAIVAPDAECLQDAVDRLMLFLRDFRLQVSVERSWVWATTTHDRRCLKHADIDGVSPPVRLFAEDLGCDTSYCGRPIKLKAKKRQRKAIKAVSRVRTLRYPANFTRTMVNALANGIVGYGSEITHKAEWKTLRSQMCKGLNRSKSGANGLLTLSTIGEFQDPML